MSQQHKMLTEKLDGQDDRFKPKGWMKLAAIAARAIVVEEPETDEEKILFRKDVCFSCKFRNKQKEICSICSCILKVKTESKINFNFEKQRSEVTHCPKGFWNDAELAEYYKNN